MAIISDKTDGQRREVEKSKIFSNPTCEQMIRLYMAQNGFTALLGDEGCGCGGEDLFCCGFENVNLEECQAAYTATCKREGCEGETQGCEGEDGQPCYTFKNPKGEK